jgi:AraC-like DNA-binding protein
MEWYDLIHLILPVLFILQFSNVYFGSAGSKLDLIQEMDQKGYEIFWERGVFHNPIFINVIKYGAMYGYTALIAYLLIKPGNLAKLPKSLFNFFKIAILFLVVNLIPSFISHFGIDFWHWASIIGAATTLLAIMGIFLIPDFLFPNAFSRLNLEPNGSDLKEGGPFEPLQERQIQLFYRIDAFFREERLFLDPDFSLTSLERHFGISGRYISEAIKEGAGLNFPQYVNQARMDYFVENCSKKAFLTNKTMDEIAGDVGFRSVNNFYLHFKKAKGCTPKEFLKNSAVA